MKRDHMVNLERVMKGPFGDIKLTFRHECPSSMLLCDNGGVWHLFVLEDGKLVEKPWPDGEEEP